MSINSLLLIVWFTSALNAAHAAPAVTVSTTSPDPTNSSPIPITITFNESVTGFNVNGILVTNGTKGGFTGSADTYTVNITPTGQGEVTVSVASDVAVNDGFIGNTASNTLSIIYDSVAPTVAITSAAPDPTNVSPIPVTIAFSESVTGFIVSDITVTNGTAGDFDGSGKNYTASITPTAAGTVTVSVAANKAFDAASNGNMPSNSFTRIFDNTPPGITNTTDMSVVAGSAITFKATITDNETSISATVEYRSISAGGATTTKNMTPGSPYSFTIGASQVGALGIEYKISATSLGGTNTTGTAFKTVKVNFPNYGLTIPYNSFGGAISNYRIVAVPLELGVNNNVSDVFNELIPEDNEQWRMYHYDEGFTPKKTKQLTGNSEIKPGLGYWLIVRSNPGTLTSGPGVSVDATTDAPFEIQLKKDWNQIGNPYNFNLLWADVVAANPGLGLPLVVRLYNGDFVDGTILNKMQGGFVKVNAATTLKFPVKKNPAAGGRMGEEKMPFLNEFTNPEWQVILQVKQAERVNRISGFGMNHQASDQFDQYDGFNMPRFFESYLELNHNKKEGDDFYSKDIVPTTDQYEWEFFIESTMDERLITFEWDNSYFGENEKELYLWDVSRQRAVDMRTVTSYAFDKQNSKSFKVFYGSKDFVKKETAVNEMVLHSIFPNPADGDVTVSFTLPESASTQAVTFLMTDVMGRKCWDFSGSYKSGYHEVTWKRTQEETNGIYLISLKAGTKVKQARVIMK